MTDDATTKRAAIYMLERGLASYAEIAELSGRSRQIVLHWGKDTAWQEARKARLERYLARLSRDKNS